MPTEPQIEAQMATIRARLSDYARSFPTAVLTVGDDQLRAQALVEITGNYPPLTAPSAPPELVTV